MLVLGTLGLFRFELNAARYRHILREASSRYGVPPELIAAVIWQETAFTPGRRGKAGEIGLMQIMPQSAAEWARAEKISGLDTAMLSDPRTNILAGTWYLGRALRRWAGQANPVPYALAEYNAGRSNALRWERGTSVTPDRFTEQITYPSTRSYVRNIERHYRTFGRPWLRW